eukprot:359985-Chlamydomonas_euryale.AAC.1
MPCTPHTSAHNDVHTREPRARRRAVLDLLLARLGLLFVHLPHRILCWWRARRERHLADRGEFPVAVLGCVSRSCSRSDLWSGADSHPARKPPLGPRGLQASPGLGLPFLPARQGNAASTLWRRSQAAAHRNLSRNACSAHTPRRCAPLLPPAHPPPDPLDPMAALDAHGGHAGGLPFRGALLAVAGLCHQPKQVPALLGRDHHHGGARAGHLCKVGTPHVCFKRGGAGKVGAWHIVCFERGGAGKVSAWHVACFERGEAGKVGAWHVVCFERGEAGKVGARHVVCSGGGEWAKWVLGT